MPDNFKPYSVDNYDKLRPSDFVKIYNGLTDRDNNRLKILRFLAKQAKEAKYAKSRRQIAAQIGIRERGVSVQSALEHCDALKGIGVIRETRSKSDDDDPSAGPREITKYYLDVENLIEISAILTAGMLGLDKDGARKIKRAITRIFNQNPTKFFMHGIYGGAKFLDIQEQILDAIKDIAYNYTQAQKDAINWWSAIVQSNIGYYYLYPWLYPKSFVNMASQAYKSFADYATSSLNIAQNNFDAYIDVSKTYSRLVAGNTNEMSQMAANSLKIFGSALPLSMITRDAGTATIPPDLEVYSDETALSEWEKLRNELTEIVQIARGST